LPPARFAVSAEIVVREQTPQAAPAPVPTPAAAAVGFSRALDADALATSPAAEAAAAAYRAKKAALSVPVLEGGGGSSAKLGPAHVGVCRALVALLRHAVRAHPLPPPPPQVHAHAPRT
jgi:hypothetical protein